MENSEYINLLPEPYRSDGIETHETTVQEYRYCVYSWNTEEREYPCFSEAVANYLDWEYSTGLGEPGWDEVYEILRNHEKNNEL